MCSYFVCVFIFSLFFSSNCRWQDKSVFVSEGQRAILPLEDVKLRKLNGAIFTWTKVSAPYVQLYKFKIRKLDDHFKVITLSYSTNGKFRFHFGHKMWVMDRRIMFYPSNGTNSTSLQIFPAENDDSGQYLCKYGKKGKMTFQYKIYLSVEKLNDKTVKTQTTQYSDAKSTAEKSTTTFSSNSSAANLTGTPATNSVLKSNNLASTSTSLPTIASSPNTTTSSITSADTKNITIRMFSQKNENSNANTVCAVKFNVVLFFIVFSLL